MRGMCKLFIAQSFFLGLFSSIAGEPLIIKTLNNNKK